MSSKMTQRIITALCIIAAVLPPVLLGGIWIKALIAFIMIGGSYEGAKLHDGNPNYLLTALCVVALVGLIYAPATMYMAVLSIWVIVLFTYIMVDVNADKDALIYAFVITVLLSMAGRCVEGIYTTGNGAVILLYIIIACFGCDTGAYFFGVFFGKHKMIPHISPNKTWEGSVGGYFTGAILSFVFALVFRMAEIYPLAMIATASLTLPIVSQLGDLTFSAMKRRFEIKDFSNLFPGHGGVLDRIDSLIFCLMTFNALMLLWGIVL